MLSNLTKKNFRSKRRSCALCKPQNMHWTDSRTVQVQREAWRHKEQLEKPTLGRRRRPTGARPQIDIINFGQTTVVFRVALGGVKHVSLIPVLDLRDPGRPAITSDNAHINPVWQIHWLNRLPPDERPSR